MRTARLIGLCVQSYSSPSLLIPGLQEDSVLLWKTVCSNKLLANVDLVLFLNKCDILETKLKAGVRYALGFLSLVSGHRTHTIWWTSWLYRLAKYVKSFGDRANNLETVSKCECSLSSYLFPLSTSAVTLRVSSDPLFHAHR